MLLQNSFEGGTNGQEITEANSGGTSGDAFIEVLDDGGSPVYTNAQAAHGTLSARLPVEASFTWGMSGNGDRYVRAYVRPVLHTTSGQTHAFYLALNSSGSTVWFAELALGSSSATLTLFAWDDAADDLVTIGATSTAPLTNQWIRIEVRATNAASGSGELRLYNSPDATTPTATITGNTSQTLAAWDYLEIYHGSSDNGTGPDVWVDDLALSDTGWPGPVAGSAVDKTGTDTGTLANLASITASAARTDTAALTEQAQVGLTRTDQGTLAEQASAAPALTRADGGDLSDGATVQVTHARIDGGTLGEQATVQVAHARTDGGTLTEGPLTVALTATDSAALSEVSDVDQAFGPSTADLAALDDEASVTAAPLRADQGVLGEQAAVEVLRLGVETALLTEVSGITIPAADGGALAEVATVTAVLTSVDSLVLGELAQALQPVVASDVATLAEVAHVISLGGDITRASPPYTSWAASTPYT